MVRTSGSYEQIRKTRVIGRRQLTSRIIELELESADSSPLPGWEPGAHIDLRLGDDLVRQYSLVPSPDGSRGTWTVAILIEDEGRGGSRLIERSLHVGSTVNASGPRNHFPLVPASSYLFIAGGIGVTPIIAMCRAAEAQGATWRFAYLGRSRETMAYVHELEREFPGRIDVYESVGGERYDVAAAVGARRQDEHVYCCGPDRLMSAVEDAMLSPDQLPYVHLEHFQPRETDASPNLEFRVYAVASDVEFVVPADESVLMAADFEGLVVPGDCLEGTCGSCETRVVRGEIDHRDSILSPQQRSESATMMICVSRAKPGCSRLELDL